MPPPPPQTLLSARCGRGLRAATATAIALLGSSSCCARAFHLLAPHAPAPASAAAALTTTTTTTTDLAWVRARGGAGSGSGSQQSIIATTMRRPAPHTIAMAAALSSSSSSSSSSSASASPPAQPTGNWSPAVYVSDQQRPFRLSDFALPKHLLETGELESILLPSGIIHDRIDKMAQDLLADVAAPSSEGNERSIHLLCTLKGAGRFFQELLDALKRRAQAADVPLRISIDYVRVKSYSGMQSTGQVKVEGADLAALQAKDVVLVEDIIDTGTTLRKLVPLIQAEGQPKSLRVVSLFQKRLGPEKNPSTEPIPCLHVVGFSLPDRFAVGWGMDYNEVYRDLEHLCLLSPKGVEMHKE